MHLCLGTTAELLVPSSPGHFVELGNDVAGSRIGTGHCRYSTALMESVSDAANNVVLGTEVLGTGAGGPVSGAILTAIDIGRAMTGTEASWTR